MDKITLRYSFYSHYSRTISESNCHGYVASEGELRKLAAQKLTHTQHSEGSVPLATFVNSEYGGDMYLRNVGLSITRGKGPKTVFYNTSPVCSKRQ
jgi:hypothetical protein